jgi:hypothetical protein
MIVCFFDSLMDGSLLLDGTHVVRMSFGRRPYEAFDWFKPLKHYIVTLRLEKGGNIMDCTQYLDLAHEHRSLVLIGLSFRGRTDLYIPP